MNLKAKRRLDFLSSFQPLIKPFYCGKKNKSKEICAFLCYDSFNYPAELEEMRRKFL